MITREEALNMAREAGIGWAEGLGGMDEFLEVFAKMVAKKIKLDALKSAMHQTQMIGRKCLSEDDCITSGIDFAAYERGVIHAVGAMQNHLMEAIASDKKEGAEA